MNRLLAGKVALVTGGARGMGAAQARLFVSHGATVFIADIRDDEGRALAAGLGAPASYVHLDVASEDEWRSVVTGIGQAHGGLDVLVNNAGIFRSTALEDTSLEEYMKVVNVNQVGTFLGMRSVIPLMKARGGASIVNISSADGMRGTNGLSSYASSKWAVRGLSRVAARELGQYGIRVNSVHPGAIETPMTAGMAGMSAAPHEEIRKTIPLERPGKSDEVALTVLFLASGLSSYTSGGEFLVDGGLTNCNLYEGMPGSPGVAPGVC